MFLQVENQDSDLIVRIFRHILIFAVRNANLYLMLDTSSLCDDTQCYLGSLSLSDMLALLYYFTSV